MPQPNGNPNVNTPKAPNTSDKSSDAAKNAGRFQNPKESEINETQEGEWKQPGQDSFPGVENAPRQSNENAPPTTITDEDSSRRYI